MTPDDWDDQIQEIWDSSIGGFLTGGDLARFTDDGAALFHDGWIENDIDPDARQDARDAFFSLMDEFDLSIDQFDWDDWRDWYEAA